MPAWGVYEDGETTRDCCSLRDGVQGNIRTALTSEGAREVLNVGLGHQYFFGPDRVPKLRVANTCPVWPAPNPVLSSNYFHCSGWLRSNVVLETLLEPLGPMGCRPGRPRKGRLLLGASNGPRAVKFVIGGGVLHDPDSLLRSAEGKIGPAGPKDHARWEVDIKPVRDN